MVLLTPEELETLSELDRRVYQAILAALQAHPHLPLSEAETGFWLRPDLDVAVDNSHYVFFRLRFTESSYPGLSATFGPYPQAIHFFLEDAPSLRDSPIFLAIEREQFARDEGFLWELARFLDDWLGGCILVEISYSCRVPYRWRVMRAEKTLWSRRRLVYPYFGWKTIARKRCPMTNTTTTAT